MSSNLHFPSQQTLQHCLFNHRSLNLPYYREKGISEAIAKLAAERFADSEMVSDGVKLGAMLVIYDIRKGEDGFTGKPLPNFKKVGLDDMSWNFISMSTEDALLSCARKG